MPNVSVKNSQGTHSPIILCNNAKTWIDIFDEKIKDNDLSVKNTAVICLLFGLELYLKAYLVFLNNNNYHDKVMRGLSHNFEKIYVEIERSAPSIFTSTLKDLLDFVGLRNLNNFSELRYPQVNSTTTYPRIIFVEGENIFMGVIEDIKKQIFK